MKKKQQICLVLTCFLITVPFLGQNAKGAITVGDYSINSTSGFYINWNVTSVSNFYIMACGMYGCFDGNVQVGDQFRFVLKGQAYFSDYNPWMGTGDPTQYPCFSATLLYYNATKDSWQYILGNDYGGSSAVLMYNSTSDTYYGAGDFYGKYLLIMLPTNINLTHLGDGLLFEKARNQIYNFPWNSFSATTDTINFTDSSNNYNYIKLRNDGIVDTWDYEKDGNHIVAEYLSSGHEAPEATIPFGADYIVYAGFAVIGLLIIVRKKILIKREN